MEPWELESCRARMRFHGKPYYLQLWQQSWCSGKSAVVSTDIEKTDEFAAARSSTSSLSSCVQSNGRSESDAGETSIVVTAGANGSVRGPASGYEGILRDSGSVIGHIQRV